MFVIMNLYCKYNKLFMVGDVMDEETNLLLLVFYISIIFNCIMSVLYIYK